MRKSNNQLRKDLDNSRVETSRATSIICALLNRHGGQFTITQRDLDSIPSGTRVRRIMGGMDEITILVQEPFRHPDALLYHSSWFSFGWARTGLTPKARIDGWRRIAGRLWCKLPPVQSEVEDDL